MRKAEVKEKAASEKATKMDDFNVKEFTQSFNKYLSKTLSRHWHGSR